MLRKRYSLIGNTWSHGAEVARLNRNLGPVCLQNTWCEKSCGIYMPMRKQPPWTFRTGDIWVSPEGKEYQIDRVEKDTAYLVDTKTTHVIRKNRFLPLDHDLKQARTNVKRDYPRWVRSVQGPVPSSVRQPKAIRDMLKKDHEKAEAVY